MPRLLEGSRDIDFERTEPCRKRLQLRRIELLRREAQHAIPPERPKDLGELFVIQLFRDIHLLNCGAEDVAGRSSRNHVSTPAHAADNNMVGSHRIATSTPALPRP